MPSPLSRYADVHTHRLDAGPDAIINLPAGADVPPQGSYSVGIHPWDAARATEADMQWVERAAELPQVVAIGETGLDALRGGPLDEQERVFVRHVMLSERLGKPLIIHAVRTLHRIMALRKSLRPAQTWVIHGFRGKPALAQQLVRSGCDISIGALHHPGVPAGVPPDRLHRESDGENGEFKIEN